VRFDCIRVRNTDFWPIQQAAENCRVILDINRCLYEFDAAVMDIRCDNNVDDSRRTSAGSNEVWYRLRLRLRGNVNDCSMLGDGVTV
jgi:hypothetical protein